MPRYKSRRKKPFKRIKTAKALATFIAQLGPREFKALQEAAKTRQSKHVHPGAFKDLSTGSKQQLIHAIHEEEKARHSGSPVGGGLTDAFSDMGSWMWDKTQTLVPGLKIANGLYHGVANNVSAMTHDNSISDHTHQIADFVQLAYSDDVDKPTDVAGYTRDSIYDRNQYIDVWQNSDTDHVIVAVRGTKTSETSDLAEDSKILTGGSPQDLISSDLQEIVQKYGDDSIEIAGHSLGSSLIGAAFDSKPGLLDSFDRVDLFNPGSSPLAESNVVNALSDKEQVHWYMNSADLVGWGALAQNTLPSDNLVMNGPQGFSPLANHGIEQWTSDPKN